MGKTFRYNKDDDAGSRKKAYKNQRKQKTRFKEFVKIQKSRRKDPYDSLDDHKEEYDPRLDDI